MKETPLLDRLLELQEEKIVSFHVPGHKNGKIFNTTHYKNFKKFLPDIDTTEIIGTDYLHNPKEVIQKAQQRASEVFKSDATFFLINGSTSGIYSMIMAVTSPGDKIIVARNCHQSVINATILGDLVPVYLYPEMDSYHGIPLGISPEEVKKKLIACPDAKAVMLTYPTYHGFTSDLKKIAEIVHGYGKILLVDEAHGAHLGLNEKLPMTALECGADAVVQSTHKTLPAFTQSSMLHVQGNKIDIDKLKFMLKIHQSSSPSYILMASLDLATTIYQDLGSQLMEALLEHIEEFKSKIKGTKGVTVLEDTSLGKNSIKGMDATKLWISMEQNQINGYQLEKKLRNKYGIQMELSNMYGILGVTSIANDGEDFEKLYEALTDIAKKEGEGHLEKRQFFSYPIPKQMLTPKEALYRKKKQVPIEKSIGFVSGEYLIPYPPGIPILMPGEVIEEEIITYIRVMIESGMEILGLKDHQWKNIEILV
ncbi:aminotransferase class I/II-fold pyridoxal phosphate-dependent enzyme [Clostridium formicaceticum]|uniref:Arginine decarboxylase n=1 Tax=Clostridium formicaceticum TaxID=1497 RepID=A0AAC9RFK8_9CLOT|nr:aminotransferase class V-fold PLP-dependent enzyme [Clostridium formicaceticum]AOY75472.1 arginine decarboxylase [Clostridium formicaceticum]ARE85759.1 Arginine decarboxylase [Clostridium formicaceticum]